MPTSTNWYVHSSTDSQNSKNDRRCASRISSINTVPTVYQQCTNRQKQSKDSQNSKKMTIGVQSSHVYTVSAEYTKPRRLFRGNRFLWKNGGKHHILPL